VKEKPMPADVAYNVALAALRIAAANPEQRPRLIVAIDADKRTPRQSIVAEMSNYLGVALIIFVAKFGFLDGKIVIPPMGGKVRCRVDEERGSFAWLALQGVV
jgi:hypothetical protein